ncbi:MAG: BTAD domain-containing putative transcriptional regulator [Caldilineaceae bacterium]
MTAFESSRVRGLLAYLAVEGHIEAQPHQRHRLAQLLWPDHPPLTARTNLRHVLRQLRNALPDDPETLSLLLTTRDTIQFNPAAGHSVDVVRFSQLCQSCEHCQHQALQHCAACIARYREAAALYQGNFLDGFFLDGSANFEEWIVVQRTTLQRQALEIVYALTTYYEEQGDHHQAQHYARRQIELDPWREESHRQLMRNLALGGERTAALMHFEQVRQILADELGVEPTRETTTLYEQIRLGHFPKSLSSGTGSAAQPLDDGQIAVPPSLLSAIPLSASRGLAADAPYADRRPASLAGEPRTNPVDRLPTPQQDWGEAPMVAYFFGREAELAQLQRWLLGERCRLISVLAMGGMGKTTLVAKAAHQVAADYEFVFWRSLLNAPPFPEYLRDCLRFLARQQLTQLPESLNEQVTLLITHLRQARTLLVLDNVESILDAGSSDHYRPGYEAYRQLIERIAQSEHQSTLVLTSRERPRGVGRLEQDFPWVRSLLLQGLEITAGQALLKMRGLGSSTALTSLVERYSGNPLALRLVARTIQELFDDDITAFLADETPIFDDIRTVLDQQFARLMPLEREILIWLAIERDGISLTQLADNFFQPPPRRDLLEAIRGLQRHSLLEKMETGFTLQNVVSEYVTDWLIAQICREIERGTLDRLIHHALLKTRAKEYVRQSQARLLLAPIAARLEAALPRNNLEKQLCALLDSLRTPMAAAPAQTFGYAATNILHLLIQLGFDLQGYDFSQLRVRQAFLRGVALPAVNFAQADLTGSIFTDTFRSMTCVAFSPQRDPAQQLLAAGSGDGTIRLWQVADRLPSGICIGHTSYVWAVAFSPDGQWLASAGEDATVRLWNAQTSQLRHTFVGHTLWLKSVAFSPDGRLLASSGGDGTVRLWDLQNNEPWQILHSQCGAIWSIAFSPDGRLLAGASEDSAVLIWDVQSGDLRHTLLGHSGRVTAVAFRPRPTTDAFVATTAEDTETWLVSSAHDKTAKLWNVERGRLLHTFSVATRWVNSVAFHPDGTCFVTGANDMTPRVWNVQADADNPQQALHGHLSPVAGVAFSPDGRLLASASEDHTVRLWDARSGQAIDVLHGYPQSVLTATFCLGGAFVASGGWDRLVRLWDARSGEEIFSLAGHSNAITAITATPHPDGAHLLLASSSLDRTVCLWLVPSDGQTLERGRLLYKCHGHTLDLTAVTFSPDGALLASGANDRTARIWSLQHLDRRLGHMQPLHTLTMHSNAVMAVAFSPNGKVLASGGRDRLIYLTDVNTGETVGKLEGHTKWVKAVAFSPDGRLLASGSDEDLIRLWDVEQRTLIKTLHGHTNVIESVDFSPHDTDTDLLLASASYDGTVRIWNIETGEAMRVLQGHTNWVRSVRFSPDGQWVVSCSDDETVRIWSVVTGECLHTLRAAGPYAGMNIAGVIGISEAQRSALKALDAVE